MADVPEVRVLGVPVTVQPAFLLTAVVLGLGRTPLLLAEWVVVLFTALLLHEMGHALAARSFGHRPTIAIGVLGGKTSVDDDRPVRRGERLLSILAGPVAGLALGLLFLAVRAALTLADDGGLLGVVVTDLAVTNLGLSFFNLVPVLPLDGGQSLRTLADAVTGGRGLRPTLVISMLVAGAAVALPVVLGPEWLRTGVVALFLCVSNARSLLRFPADAAAAARAGDVATARRLLEGRAALERHDPVAASTLAHDVLESQANDAVRVGAVNLLIWAALLQGQTAKALHAAEAAPAGHPDAPLLHESVLRAVGGAERAITLLQTTFATAPGDTAAVLLTRGLVEDGRLDAAVGFVTGPEVETFANNPAAIVGRALFEVGRYEDAARVGQSTFARHPHPVLAYNVACAWVTAGHTDRALHWLEQAVDAGYDDLAELDRDPSLDPLRLCAEFEALRHRVTSHTR